MTEKEAKTNWCPMYRVGFNPEYKHNRISDGVSSRCIGAKCMWWCWNEADLDDDNHWGHTGDGYCGAIK